MSSQPIHRLGVRVPPEHDTVVLGEGNRVIRSYKLGGLYSDEETAARREANRERYAPKRSVGEINAGATLGTSKNPGEPGDDELFE